MIKCANYGNSFRAIIVFQFKLKQMTNINRIALQLSTVKKPVKPNVFTLEAKTPREKKKSEVFIIKCY